MDRRNFLNTVGLASAGLFIYQHSQANPEAGLIEFPVVRLPKNKRRFSSVAIDKAIEKFKSDVKDKELSWLFENCFPNTLDTTVFFSEINNKPDTYVITGDIDAMWLRDSAAQVWPYISFIRQDKDLQQLIVGVINRQVKCILKDPYANAFYNDESKRGEWAEDLTDMKPGIHERKWEIDSLCYPIRLAYKYWKESGDSNPFDDQWKASVISTLQVFREQQRKENQGTYTFQRRTSWATDGVPLAGYGYPAKPIGLIHSIFRPSDDATVFPFLIPANFFAVVSLRQAAEMVTSISNDIVLAKQLSELANEVEGALSQYSTFQHTQYGKIYAYEVNGYESFNLMDDSNIPSLLSLPYLGAVKVDDVVYRNTRRYVLSLDNPFFFKGKSGEGVGGPHAGMNMIWPLSIIMRGLTSSNDEEIRNCISMLKSTHGNTGFMHESFHKDDPNNFTRKWFAWANTLFGEFLWKVYQEKPHLLKLDE